MRGVSLHSCHFIELNVIFSGYLVLFKGIPFRRQDVSIALRQYLNRQALFGTERKLFVELCAWMERVLHSGALYN